MKPGGVMMRTAGLDSADERGPRLEEVFDKYQARLRRYFFVHLGDGAEADACAAETVRRLFDFMEGRAWGREAGYVNFYLMSIAFGVCARRQAEKEREQWTDTEPSGREPSRSTSTAYAPSCVAC